MPTRIEPLFTALKSQRRAALIAYVTAGDPTPERTPQIVAALERGGVDLIELGVPFSDPIADGPVIQRASERALRHGTSLSQVLEVAKKIRKKSEAGLIIFTYLNPILRMGLAEFAAAAQDACVDGALIIDLPVEESGDYLADMHKRNLATVFLAAPTSTDARLKQIARASTGFVYAVSRTGVTGARQQMPEDAPKLVSRLRRYTDLPVAVGFGISTPAQFEAVGKFADAAVVGSAIVQTIERNPGKEAESVAQFIKQLSAVSHQPSVLI